jgi:hypothetical protein
MFKSPQIAGKYRPITYEGARYAMSTSMFLVLLCDYLFNGEWLTANTLHDKNVYSTASPTVGCCILENLCGGKLHA